jgi:prophage DNA circulation protein
MIWRSNIHTVQNQIAHISQVDRIALAILENGHNRLLKNLYNFPKFFWSAMHQAVVQLVALYSMDKSTLDRKGLAGGCIVTIRHCKDHVAPGKRARRIMNDW